MEYKLTATTRSFQSFYSKQQHKEEQYYEYKQFYY
jgi:hypothetical protein